MTYEKKDVEIGIIGGTGADIALENVESYKIYTPYGAPSDEVKIGTFNGKKVAFLERHGPGHSQPPHALNYRANIWAMKEIGVKRIFSPCAVGGLTPKTGKGVFVIVDQYIDRTKGRNETFYDGGQVCHLAQADPFCPEMNKVFYETGKELGLNIIKGGTYVCINGPRFSTRAESRMYANWGGDVIGMTVYPEIVLAGELNMCYSSIATVTDLDAWACECKKCGIVMYGEKCPSCGGKIIPLSVSVEEILETMAKNTDNLRKLLETAIPKIPSDQKCSCPHARDGAVM
ncbi:S-methyl-5'-thioadenosine phosphorylase [Candidatus Lokiarchaeum ossiferum]|uniref:S-methyl-5'-thioadenosine phosphorylase n=1 Tax=Candidatus Lokiarchaeum ossiferum TaxID=2951803 RepID=UPI00352E8C57